MTKLEEELESACKDASAAFEAAPDTDADWDAADNAWDARNAAWFDYRAELKRTQEENSND